jgi:hypothetical protein
MKRAEQVQIRSQTVLNTRTSESTSLMDPKLFSRQALGSQPHTARSVVLFKLEVWVWTADKQPVALLAKK